MLYKLRGKSEKKADHSDKSEKQRQEILLYSDKTIRLKHKSLKETKRIRYIDAEAMTKLKYKVISGSEFITVSKSGKVSIKRKAKKEGTRLKLQR